MVILRRIALAFVFYFLFGFLTMAVVAISGRNPVHGEPVFSAAGGILIESMLILISYYLAARIIKRTPSNDSDRHDTTA
jgi:hypothetical protein